MDDGPIDDVRAAEQCWPDLVGPALGYVLASCLSVDGATRTECSAIDGRTPRLNGYAISQTIRKRIVEHFG